MNVQVRNPLASERQAVLDVAAAAFGDAQGREITDLIAGLLEDPTARPFLSLVATADDRIVGHVLFTGATVRHSPKPVSATLLAPLSVHPAFQGRGIGGKLIDEGIKQLKAMRVDLVFVLGHPGYYPKHGFSPAGIKGLDAPYPIPPEHADAWMVFELTPGTIGRVSGRVACADVLNDPKHWRE